MASHASLDFQLATLYMDTIKGQLTNYAVERRHIIIIMTKYDIS